MVVSARPLDGRPGRGARRPWSRTRRARTWAVGVAAVAGRAVRIVLDPVPALGTSVEVQSVGPVTAPLPGWTVAAGALDRRGSVRRGVLAVRDAPLRIASPGFRPGSGARELVVAVRGDGVLRGVAGRRAAAVRATPALARPARAGAGRARRRRVSASPPRPARGAWRSATSGSCAVRSPCAGCGRPPRAGGG